MSIAKPEVKTNPDVLVTKQGVDVYQRTMDVGFATEKHGFVRLCNVTNGIGHCCAASMIGNLTSYFGFWNSIEKVDKFLDFFRDKWEKQEEHIDDKYNRLSCFIISGFYVLLSPETYSYDAGIRKNPQFTKVHSFNNRKFGPDHDDGNQIDLYFINF